ncbi:PaaI family thioesterase [Candidatus Halocynthiibacter alkanivorans]|uniref:PaaI family thioesterase n=1 Tax=Candidatus Halocynthiibacter alkanivorans TaxID=2267619 RepID=UPI000DF3CC60|nr:PaaI family thioesterase [Candidatus Halocynthiibacter alkanivorans]
MVEASNKVIQSFIEKMPHAEALGLKILQLSAGEAEMLMPWSEDLIGDPATGVIHGGAVSTLMDTCSGAAVICHPENGGVTATLDLRIDYMRPASPGQDVRAHAECYNITRSIAFVRATAFDDDASRPVATATGAFTIAFRKEASA